MKQQKNIHVIKRNGEKELLDLSKFSRMVEEACEGLSGVSASQIEMKSGIQFYDGMTTKDIQNILIRSASDLIDLDYPNYQYAAARLLLYGLYKDVYGSFDPIPLKEMIEKNINLGVYDSEILNWYSDEEFYVLQSYMRFDRDLNFTYAGLRQIYDKYLVQNRVTNEIYETPQFMYMLIALTLFHNYPKETRLSYIKKYYDAISNFKISLPTPVMGGVRTPLRQFASCALVDSDDSLDSIFASNTAVGLYTAKRSGIGLNMGRIRGIGSQIRGGEVVHTGILPFLKMFVATTRSCTQNSIRGGAQTIHFPLWHSEIETILVLKNNKGTEENRERKTDYAIQISKLFYQRYIDNEKISLFSPHSVPGLYDAFGTDAFDEIYIKAEKNKLYTKQLPAKELFESLFIERAETGRIYIQNLDHVNSHSPFNDKISMSNLCLTGDTQIRAKLYDNLYDWDLQGVVQSIVAGHPVEVLSYNFKTNSVEYKPVTAAALTYKNTETFTVTYEHGKIKGTPNHPIYVEEKGWVEIKDLKSGDILKTIDGISKVLSVVKEQTNDVFDISVDGNHNFFANDILVHNCQEIALPTKPIVDINDNNGEIATCILSAINLGKINKLTELEPLCDLAVRALEEIIDFQGYPVKAAENYTKKNRTLGVGYIGVAHYLAKNKVKYSDPNAWQLMHDTTEAFQYYLMNASAEIAKEKGACTGFANSKLAEGILPIDTYKTTVDEILIDKKLKMPWEELRAKIKETGIRNLTTSCAMPAESCGKFSNKIKTSHYGNIDFHEICEINNIDWKQLEDQDIPIWIDFEKPMLIPTRHGNAFSNRIYYNGKKPVYELTMEDGNTYSFTGNHKLLVNDEWIYVEDMKGNDFVSLEQGSLKIISINKKEPVATYDIEVEGHHEYLLDNGIVSHNSAVVSNATNGIEPPRGFLSVKKSKKGTLKQIVPSYSSLKNHYTLLWDMPDMTGYINICAVMQKFIDQSISANTSYDASKWENSKIPMSVFARDILYGYKMGIKNWYYHNTNDGKKEDEDVEIKPEVLVEKTDDGDDEVCEACTI